MSGNITYVQKELSMELNKDIVSIAGKYAGYEKLVDGFSVWFYEAPPVSAFRAGGLDDLNSFYGSETNENTKASGKAGFRVDFRVITDEIIRVTVNGAKNGKSGLFVKYKGTVPPFDFKENGDFLVLRTTALEVIADKKKSSYSVVYKHGKTVFEERNNEKSIYSGYYSPPLSKVRAEGCNFMCQSFKRSGGEDFYGFGEQFLDFNKKGLVTEIWNVDPANTMSFKSYKNIPFFISTKGYGFLLNSSRKSIFDMGSKTSIAYNVKVQGDELDYYLIFADDLKGVLKKYYMLTGNPSMTPRWSFGLWMSTHTVYKSDQALIDIAREIRSRELPADVLHIDPPWMNLNSLVCHLEWGDNFKNHVHMVKVLREKGFKLSLWIAPYVPMNCKMYEEGLKGGYFVKDREGNLIVNKGLMNFWSPDFVYIDFTNPEAEAWFKQKIKRVINEGADVIKVDLGELGPEEALYSNGMDGAEGHNYYTLEYQRVVYEATREVKGDEAMIWCRSGFIGSHMYPVHWAGDVACDFDNMEGQLRAILGAGMSGFIFFSHDIGGFSGTPTPELYTRWFQFGMFTSHARAHGGARHEPWFYGEKVMEICKKYAMLRYSLLPHIYSSAAECCKKCEPMLKALVLEYPDDLNVRNIDSEYLFCDDFLVAPMFKAEGSRKVYLPEGVWIDYWDGRHFEGGKWIEYECNLERMPLFVRAGSIILKKEPEQFITSENSWKKLIVEIYPALSGAKKVFYNKNDYGTISYETHNSTIKVNAESISDEIDVRIVDNSGKIKDIILTRC